VLRYICVNFSHLGLGFLFFGKCKGPFTSKVK